MNAQMSNMQLPLIPGMRPQNDYAREHIQHQPLQGQSGQQSYRRPTCSSSQAPSFSQDMIVEESEGSATPVPASSSSSFQQEDQGQLRNGLVLAGGDPVVSEPVPYSHTDAYKILTALGTPSTEMAMQFLPIRDFTTYCETANTAVVKIYSVPFDVTKNMIIAYLGQYAMIAQQEGAFKVHIPIDRTTGKTSHTAYVEMISDGAAQQVMEDLKLFVKRNRQRPRLLGDRKVKVEISTVEELKRTMLPRAYCQWDGHRPIISPNSGFVGFVAREELRALVNLTRKIGRSHFGRATPQRPYEIMMSILMLYPWNATDSYSIQDRDMIFYYTKEMIKSLENELEVPMDSSMETKLTITLLRELTAVAMSVPAFHCAQQASLWGITQSRLTAHPIIRTFPRLCAWWPFKALTVPLEVQDSLVEYYGCLIREATTSLFFKVANEMQENFHVQHLPANPSFGPIPFPQGRERCSFSLCAQLEFDVIARLIQKVCNYASANPTYGRVLPTYFTTLHPDAGPYFMCGPTSLEH